MGADGFFDGVRFDPRRPVDYLRDFSLHKLKIDLEALRAYNV
jgi:hypothetical protein